MKLLFLPSIAFVVLAAAPPLASAGDVEAKTLRVAEIEGSITVELSLSWRNGWRNERNHDAVWITLRRREPGAPPVPLAASGHRALEGGTPVRIDVAEDRLGAFVSAASSHRGDVSCELVLALAPEAAVEGAAGKSGALAVEPFALEMVFVPGGPFELGDDKREVALLASFFRRGEAGKPPGVYRVESEAAIEVGAAPGRLDYEVGREAQYRGDRAGPIPAEWPKGTRAFYVQKYELRQGEYAEFLNRLPPEAQALRGNVGAEGEEAATNTIAREGDRFVAKSPRRAANFVSWSDTCALADWAGLRPLTEFEYEKACRGPTRPVAGDYPWGTASRESLERVVTKERDLAHSTSDDEVDLDDETRRQLGASFYWVMDLSGGVWERAVTAGHAKGRAFRGTHGDGRLDPATARATNDDWPKAGTDEQEADGIGFRGGAEYFAKPDVTNPNSPVAARTYGAWNGAMRYKTYSARACRTAPAAD